MWLGRSIKADLGLASLTWRNGAAKSSNGRLRYLYCLFVGGQVQDLWVQETLECALPTALEDERIITVLYDDPFFRNVDLKINASREGEYVVVGGLADEEEIEDMAAFFVPEPPGHWDTPIGIRSTSLAMMTMITTTTWLKPWGFIKFVLESKRMNSEWWVAACRGTFGEHNFFFLFFERRPMELFWLQKKIPARSSCHKTPVGQEKKNPDRALVAVPVAIFKSHRPRTRGLLPFQTGPTSLLIYFQPFVDAL